VGSSLRALSALVLGLLAALSLWFAGIRVQDQDQQLAIAGFVAASVMILCAILVGASAFRALGALVLGILSALSLWFASLQDHDLALAITGCATAGVLGLCAILVGISTRRDDDTG